VRRLRLGASGAKKLCALGAKGWRFCAAPQLGLSRDSPVHPLDRTKERSCLGR
jgi:hypothetical protein